MFVRMWVQISPSCCAYVAQICGLVKQVGGEAEDHCLLKLNEQQDL